MSKEPADISYVGRWFLGNSLPWSDATALQRLAVGVNCVEHLKECTEEEWANLFTLETPITRRVASRGFTALKIEGECDPKKCASQLGIVQASKSPPVLLSLSQRGRLKDDGSSHRLTAKGITVKFIPKETKKRMRLSAVTAAKADVATVMDDSGEGGGLAGRHNE